MSATWVLGFIVLAYWVGHSHGRKAVTREARSFLENIMPRKK